MRDATFAARQACPLCESREWGPVRVREPELRRCSHCHLAYRVDPIHPLATPQRSATELAKIDTSRLDLFRRTVAQLGTPARGDILLDIGASSGYFVECAGQAGWRAVGVEFGSSLAQIARDLDRCVIVGDGQRLPLRAATVAVVTLWDVLDQLDEPRRAVAEAARVLRPGGLLWLRVRHGGVHLMMRRHRWLPKRLSVLHNNLYSPRCLRTALRNAGFRDIRVATSPTSVGDPYASMQSGVGALVLRAAKGLWDAFAGLLTLLSAGNVVLSPSITTFARRADKQQDELP